MSNIEFQSAPFEYSQSWASGGKKPKTVPGTKNRALERGFNDLETKLTNTENGMDTGRNKYSNEIDKEAVFGDFRPLQLLFCVHVS